MAAKKRDFDMEAETAAVAKIAREVLEEHEWDDVSSRVVHLCVM